MLTIRVRAGTEMQTTDCFLIDDVGRERPWPGSRIRAELGGRAPDFDIADYAVRNLGYVAVAFSPRYLRVRLRPSLVSPPAAAALLTHIADRRPGRVAISWLAESWRHEVVGNTRTAIARLGAIFADGIGEGVDGRFVATRRSLGSVLATIRHPFAPLLNRWLDAALPDDLVTLLETHGLSHRSAIFERDGATGDFVFRHSGAGIRVYGAAWPGNALGRRLQDMPDPAYGQWIGATYRMVDDVQVARHELVHATIAGADRVRRRWRYERLLLPWRRSDGRRLLLTVSTNVHMAEI